MADNEKQPTRIRQVSLRNWRNFRSIDVAVDSRVFLVGPNASGKSNFLDSLRFLRDVVAVGGGFREAVRRRNGVSALRCLAARRTPDIEVHVEITDADGERSWIYELAFAQDNISRPLIRRELIVVNGRTVLSRPNERDKKDPELLTQTYLEQVSANRDFREIADFLATIRYLHLVPQLVREPERSVGLADDPYGGDFLEQIAATQDRTRTARLKRIGEALRVAVPQLSALEFHRDDKGSPHLRGRYEHWRPQGAWQMEDQFSDGTLRLLGLLWSLLDGGGPLLLEEPELSLHPEVVKVIPRMFERVQRKSGRQIFVSTHSEDLLSDEGIGLDEVILLEPGSEGTVAKPASEFKDIKELLRGGIPLGEAVLPRTRPKDVAQLSLFGV